MPGRPHFIPGAELPGAEEVFEINDFTVVTELERFVVSIESVLQEWSLAGPRPDRFATRTAITAWQSKSEKVQFGDGNHLRMTYYWPDLPTELPSPPPCRGSKEESHLTPTTLAIVSQDADFCFINNITAMYGATEYILFSPWHPEDDQIVTEDQKNTVLSAMRVAAIGSECEIPMFLQYGHIDRQLYFGVLVNRSTITLYEGSHLRRGQSRHMHLSGLLALFKEKVDCPVPVIDANDIRASVQVDFQHRDEEPDVGMDTEDDLIDVNRVPFGSNRTPIDTFTLIATWPNLKEEMLNENETYSDLDPLNAFTWAARVDFAHGDRHLSGALQHLLHLPRSKMSSDTAASLLGISGPSGIRAFGQLADGAPVSALRIGPSASITNPGGLSLDEPLLPLHKDVIARWMREVFEGVSGSSSAATTPIEVFSKNPGFAMRSRPLSSGSPARKISTLVPVKIAPKDGDTSADMEAQLRSAKAAPADSVTARLANVFCHALVESSYGPTTFAQVWHAFVARLRSNYEHNRDIPGLSTAKYPDHASCLLHQKIEMVQCCITARKRRHQLYENCSNFSNHDEFFDAEEDVGSSSDSERKSNEKPTVSTEPQGRLKLLEGGFTLKKHPDRGIHVPITQDRSPMTEDMVDAHAKYLSSLGDSDERTEAQLDTLRSDMQAFKAANPDCCIEDFIRWHSPKDLVWDEDLEEWSLSERMQLPGNSWLKCWKNAQPIPVVHQTRLFNESKIAEEILSWLESATVRQMTELIRPVIFANSARQLIRDADPVLELLEPARMAVSVHRACRTGNRDDFLEALREMRLIETDLVYYRAIYSKLDRPQIEGGPEPNPTVLRDFVVSLIREEHMESDLPVESIGSHGVPIFGGPNGFVGDAIRRMMQEKTGQFPKPHKRQYVLRWLVPRPKSHSRLMPQRLFASIEEDDFRLCGAFSEDSTFR